MVLILHICIALASIAQTTLAYLRPTRAKLHASYALIAATLVSGFYLVWSNPAHMVQACTTGLIYIGAISFATLAAHNKLARVKVPNKYE